jgi:uncharacterized phiE125 gp8 family phage protein
MALKLLTAATDLAVTLAEAKEHMRVDDAVEDALITAMIITATESAEQITGRAITPQTWELTLDEFPDALELTRVPVTSVLSLTYYDMDGVQQTLASDQYTLDTSSDFGYAYVVPSYGNAWPCVRGQINAISLRYVAGYTTVPAPIRSWILLQIGALFENREAETIKLGRGSAVKMGFVDALLARYTVESQP